MTVFAAAPRPAFEVGRVISGAFTAIWRNLARFLVCGIVLAGLPSILYAHGLASFSVDKGASVYEEIGAGWIIILFTGAALKGIVVQDCFATLSGGTSTWRQSVNSAARNLLPISAINVLVSIGTGAGFILFLIPGVILLLTWSVAYAARVIEGVGVFEALSRSRRLTQGRRWSILGIFILVVILEWAVALPVSALKAALVVSFKASPVIAKTLATPVTMVFASVLGAAIATSLYVELRRGREGVGSQTTASVFD